MTKPSRKPTKPAAAATVADGPTPTPAAKQTRGGILIGLMRDEGGKTADQLAAAVGWQVHSVRGFISGTLKKRADLEVVTAKRDGFTHYQVRDRVEA